MRSSFWCVMRSFTRRKRVGLDQVDEFPGNDARRQLGGKAANQSGRGHAVEQAPRGAGQPDIDLGDAQLDGAVDALLGQIDVIHAHDFAAAGIDDLLVEQILAHGQPGFVRLIVLEIFLFDVQAG